MDEPITKQGGFGFPVILKEILNMSGNGLVNIAVDYGDGRTSKSATLDIEDAMLQVRSLLKRVAYEKQSIVSFSVTKADVFKSLGVKYGKEKTTY